jgi:hypothetical protein
VWALVSDLLKDPERLRAKLAALEETTRSVALTELEAIRSSGGFSKSTVFPGPLSAFQEGGTADQAHDAGSFLYTSGEGELLAALALEGVAPLRVPVALAPEQDQPLAAPAF